MGTLVLIALVTSHAAFAQSTLAPSAPTIAPSAPSVAPAPGAAPSVNPAPITPPPASAGATGTAMPAAPAAQAPPEVAPTAPASPGAEPSAAAAVPSPATLSTAQLPEDLSPWGMFMNADLIVKAVMIGLALASLVTWTVWLAKTLELRAARAAVRRDLGTLNTVATFAQALEQLRERGTPVAQLTLSSAQEIRLSANLRSDGLKERIALQLERIEMAVSRKVSRGTGVLATIGSTAPFIGLFGTVYGIMDAFLSIGNQQNANLPVVAPKIAEALIATAIGLVAAIPAVMAYNYFARKVQVIADSMEGFAEDVAARAKLGGV